MEGGKDKKVSIGEILMHKRANYGEKNGVRRKNIQGHQNTRKWIRRS